MTDQLRNPHKTEPLYAHVNVFVGKYRVPEDGALALPKARVRVMRGREEEWGLVIGNGGEPWLIVQDGDFWPVMIRLTKEDIAELERALG